MTCDVIHRLICQEEAGIVGRGVTFGVVFGEMQTQELLFRPRRLRCVSAFLFFFLD